MKKLVAMRGGKPNPLVMKNGDKFDSTIAIYGQSADGLYYLINKYENCNTDPSLRYQGKSGIIAEGVYAWICRYNDKLKKHLILFRLDCLDKIEHADDLTDYMITLPSLIPNPNHDYKNEISADCIHEGGTTEWDWSMGCLTVYGKDWPEFIDKFDLDEKGIIEIKRQPGWDAPAFYQGH